jgi:hypothetical protein
MDPLYDLLQFVWLYRAELFYILGVCVFLFAVFAVYLCCAAGRKPGQEEVKPNGFNCIPLDIYLAGGSLGIYVLAILSFEGSYYLLRNSPHVIAPYILIAGYIAAMVITGLSSATAKVAMLSIMMTARAMVKILRSFITGSPLLCGSASRHRCISWL